MYKKCYLFFCQEVLKQSFQHLLGESIYQDNIADAFRPRRVNLEDDDDVAPEISPIHLPARSFATTRSNRHFYSSERKQERNRRKIPEKDRASPAIHI